VLRDDRSGRVVDERERAVSHGASQRRRKSRSRSGRRRRRRSRGRGRRRSPVRPAFRKSWVDSRRTYPKRIGAMLHLRSSLGIGNDAAVRRPKTPRSRQTNGGQAASLIPGPRAEEVALEHSYLSQIENRGPGESPRGVNSAVPSA
jgi:hypothetical protein